MKTLRKILAILMVIATVCTTAAIAASAANVCSKIGGCSSGSGTNKTVFYVTANDTKKHTLTVTQTKGTLTTDASFTTFCDKEIYGYLEVRVWGKTGGTYKELTNLKKNINGSKSDTFTVSGYKEYKVQIYSWKTSTIADYKNFFSVNLFSAANRDYVLKNTYWKTASTWEITKTKGLTYCK